MSVDGAQRDARSFAEWNEAMVLRYDIDRYYQDAHPIVRWIEERRLRALHRLAAPRAGERLLEVGVGGGHVLQRFAETRRIGIDLSATMLERARRRLGPDVPLARADAEELPFASASFDIVLCTEVLEHTRFPGRVLQELVRLCAPNGRIIVSIPNEVIIDRIKRELRRVPGLRRWLKVLAEEANEWHVHRFDLKAFKRVAADTIDLVAVRGVPVNWLPVRYAVLGRAPGPLPKN